MSGAIAPAAIFRALALSPVNNIILLGRLEVPLIILLSRIVLQERLNRYQKIGAFVVLWIWTFCRDVFTVFMAMDVGVWRDDCRRRTVIMD